jgi:nitrite reductase (NADH) small subunit
MSGDKVWVHVTQSKNIPLREGRSVRINNREIAVFNLGDRFLAIDNACPHKGGPLAEGIVSGTTVVCPLHAWKVDLNTGTVISQGGGTPCVRTYPTRVQDGIIDVELAIELIAKPPKAIGCTIGQDIQAGPLQFGESSV